MNINRVYNIGIERSTSVAFNCKEWRKTYALETVASGREWERESELRGGQRDACSDLYGRLNDVRCRGGRAPSEHYIQADMQMIYRTFYWWRSALLVVDCARAERMRAMYSLLPISVLFANN